MTKDQQENILSFARSRERDLRYRVRTARVMLGITQLQIAAWLGTTRERVSAFESATRKRHLYMHETYFLEGWLFSIYGENLPPVPATDKGMHKIRMQRGRKKQ